MGRVLLAVTGSVAAVRTPDLARSLRDRGHEVRVVATEPALAFFDPAALGSPNPDGGPILYRDADEWPTGGYRRGDPVLHIELRRWADLLCLAPLDANTLGKIALGLSDNCLTCVFRCWDFGRPVVFAPAMNTLMWDSPITRRHLGQLLADHGDRRAPAVLDLETADQVFARHAPGLVLVPPQSKRLACGDEGMGGLAEVATIVEAVDLALAADAQPRRVL